MFDEVDGDVRDRGFGRREFRGASMGLDTMRLGPAEDLIVIGGDHDASCATRRP